MVGKNSIKTVSVNLGVAQCALLYFLSMREQGISRAYLVKNLGYDKGTIRGLQKLGLIRVTEDKPKRVYITELGKKVVELNYDVCQRAYETREACRRYLIDKACDEVRFSKLTLSVPVS